MLTAADCPGSDCAMVGCPRAKGVQMKRYFIMLLGGEQTGRAADTVEDALDLHRTPAEPATH